MQQTTVTPALYFDPRGCAQGATSVRYSIYFSGKQRLIATGTILDEKDVKFIQSYRKVYARNLSKGKKAPEIEDADQKFIWDILYGDSYTDPETGQIRVGYLRRAYDVIAYLGDSFDFPSFKKCLLDFDSLSKVELLKKDRSQALTNPTLSQRASM